MKLHFPSARTASSTSLRSLRCGLWLALVLIAAPSQAGQPTCDLTACPCVKELVESIQNRGWLGVDLDPNAQGLVVVKVVDGSPAAQADLKAGDHLLEVNGVPYRKTNLAELDQVYKRMLVADRTVIYTVKRGEKTLKVPVKLGRVPEKLMAQWIGHILLEAFSVKQKKTQGDGEP